MNDHPETTHNNIDWNDVYIRLYAFADSLIRTKNWFRDSADKKTEVFLAGKSVADYVMEAITRYLENPSGYDATTGRSLVNYIHWHILRNLVRADVTSLENKETVTVYNNEDEDDGSDLEDNRALKSMLPYIEAYFDQEIDINKITADLEVEVSKDPDVEKVYLGICMSGMKRREVIKDFNMTDKEFDNAMRRFHTILKNTARVYGLKPKNYE